MGPMGFQPPVGRPTRARRRAMQQAVRDVLIGFMATTAPAQGEATKATQLS